MLEDSIRLIQETETQMEEEKLAARAKAQKIALEAEKEAAAILAAAEEKLRQEKQELLGEAERKADARRQEILALAENRCRELKARAAERQAQAMERILAKGV